MEAGLGWRLDGLAADDLGMVVLVQLSPRKSLKEVCGPSHLRKLGARKFVDVVKAETSLSL